MKKTTYLKRIRGLDHRFLLGELTKREYAAKRNKLAKQWVKFQMKQKGYYTIRARRERKT